MKTSYEKFMASSAVQESTNVELGAVKVDLETVDQIRNAADTYMFESAKIQSKAYSNIQEAFKLLSSYNLDPKPILQQFELAFEQFKKLGVEPPPALLNGYILFKKDSAIDSKIKDQTLAKIRDIDSIFGQAD
jgi:hypothetical protein